jgi:hypothetical protein
MNLFESLQQFKRIAPDPGFTEKSKRMILATAQHEEPSIGIRGIFVFLHTLETGAALVLVGFFILLVTGSFSGTKYLAPVQYSVIDPGGLHAEADAIDMQIQLANISYAEVSSTAESTTAMTGVAGVTARLNALKGAKSVGTATGGTGTGTGTGTSSSTGSSTLSVDQALKELSQ